MKKYLSIPDLMVIIVTFLLFAMALFIKGFTHSLLLEAGVLLVSIKIIMMNYKISTTNQAILKELGEIKENLEEISDKKNN